MDASVSPFHVPMLGASSYRVESDLLRGARSILTFDMDIPCFRTLDAVSRQLDDCLTCLDQDHVEDSG